MDCEHRRALSSRLGQATRVLWITLWCPDCGSAYLNGHPPPYSPDRRVDGWFAPGAPELIEAAAGPWVDPLD